MAIARTPLLAVNPQVFDQEAYDELARLFADVRQSLTDQEIALTDGSTDSGFLPLAGGTMTGDISLVFGDLISEQNPDAVNAIRIKATASDIDVVLGDVTGYFTVWNVADNNAVFHVDNVGNTEVKGYLDVNTHKILNVVDPTANQEAATKKYVDDNDADTITDVQAIAKGWINFSMVGAGSIRDSFNVSGITDRGTGTWDVEWNTNFVNTNYAPLGFSDRTTTFETSGSKTAGVTRVNVLTSAHANIDASNVYVVAFGDQ